MVTHKEKHLYQLIEKSAVIIKLIKNWSEKLGQILQSVQFCQKICQKHLIILLMTC